jgi:2,3-diketo-5-methylthiopentyl-1-phosphate enolase
MDNIDWGGLMVTTILYPDQNELRELSRRVRGLVKATYSFVVDDQKEAEKLACRIATGQTLGFEPANLDDYTDYVGRVTRVSSMGGRYVADVDFPAKLFGQDIAGILTILFGKISFYPNLKLEDVTADEVYLQTLQGPRFGLSGIKKIAGKRHSKQPLLMAILKPGLGPSDKILAEQYAKLIDAGTDLVKDDETRIDLTLDQALRRLECVLSAANGQGVYVTHLTGPAFELAYRAKKLQDHGARAFLFCPYTYGLSALQSLCQDPDIHVPIFAHPAFTGPMCSGESSVASRFVLGTALRWLGCDAVLFPSPYGAIALPKQEALVLHKYLTSKQGELKVVASVPSAGITPDLVASIREDFGADLIVNAGTGVMTAGKSIHDGVRLFMKMIEQNFPA